MFLTSCSYPLLIEADIVISLNLAEGHKTRPWRLITIISYLQGLMSIVDTTFTHIPRDWNVETDPLAMAASRNLSL